MACAKKVASDCSQKLAELETSKSEISELLATNDLELKTRIKAEGLKLKVLKQDIIYRKK